MLFRSVETCDTDVDLREEVEERAEVGGLEGEGWCDEEELEGLEGKPKPPQRLRVLAELLDLGQEVCVCMCVCVCVCACMCVWLFCVCTLHQARIFFVQTCASLR